MSPFASATSFPDSPEEVRVKRMDFGRAFGFSTFFGGDDVALPAPSSLLFDIGFEPGDLPLLETVLLLLLGPLLLLELGVFGVFRLIEFRGLVLHVEGLVGDPVEEKPVVGDEQDGLVLRIGGEVAFEPEHGVEVQVVGGLVEDEDVGFPGQQSCEGEPGALSAAHEGDGAVPDGFVEAEIGEEAAAPGFIVESSVPDEAAVQGGILLREPVQGVGVVGGDGIELILDRGKTHLRPAELGKDGVHLPEHRPVDRRVPGGTEAVLRVVRDDVSVFVGDVEGVVLMEHPEALRFGEIDLAFVRCRFSGDHAQKRGFSAPVDAHDGEPVPFFEGEADIFEDRLDADAEGEIVDADGYHGLDPCKWLVARG